jgi:ferredoxin
MHTLPQISNATYHKQSNSLKTPQLQRQTPSLKSRQLIHTHASKISDAAATIQVHFQSADVTVTARPGDNIYDLAEKNGIDTITVGCCSGNCGVCEVEVRKYNDREQSPASASSGDDNAATAIVIRSCITPLPPGYTRVEINELIDDVWGLDGYDT